MIYFLTCFIYLIKQWSSGKKANPTHQIIYITELGKEQDFFSSTMLKLIFLSVSKKIQNNFPEIHV